MKLYRETGCYVLLVGVVTEMPSLNMDEQGNYLASVEIAVWHHAEHRLKQYGVMIQGEAALHLRKYAFPGLCLWVEGDLCVDPKNKMDIFSKDIHVIAEKIKFLPRSTEPNGTITQEIYRL